jgi:hypothetical protein
MFLQEKREKTEFKQYNKNQNKDRIMQIKKNLIIPEAT